MLIGVNKVSSKYEGCLQLSINPGTTLPLEVAWTGCLWRDTELMIPFGTFMYCKKLSTSQMIDYLLFFFYFEFCCDHFTTQMKTTICKSYLSSLKVWNDVFMARTDLPRGYGGWQVGMDLKLTLPEAQRETWAW